MRYLVLATLLFGFTANASFETEIQCYVNQYVVDITSAEAGNPVVLVQVSENGSVIFENEFTLNYLVAPIIPGGDDVEMWLYETSTQDSVIGVAAVSATEAKADLFIDMGEIGYVDGATVDCKLDR